MVSGPWPSLSKVHTRSHFRRDQRDQDLQLLQAARLQDGGYGSVFSEYEPDQRLVRLRLIDDQVSAFG